MNFRIRDDLPTEYFGTVLNFVDKVMNTIEYGMFDKDGNEITDEKDWYENTRVQSPEWVIENKRGNCVDQVNLEYWFFKENGIKTKIYYIEYENGKGTSPSHMFIVLDNNDKIYWYENAWKDQAGLHEYYNLYECLSDIKNKYCPEEFLDSCKIYRIKDILEGTNPNQVLERKIIKIKDTPRLYYLGTKDFDDVTLTPCIPNNYLTTYNFADTTTERIPFFPSIEQALSDNPDVKKNDIFYVYMPDEEFEYYRPSPSEVPTVELTGEVWITKPIKVKKVGNLKIVQEDSHPMKYKIGLNNEGELKKWKYSVLNGGLIKDSYNKIQTIQELYSNYKNRNPKASERKAWKVAEIMFNNQLQAKYEAEKEEKMPNKIYVVIDYFGKELYEGSMKACEEYINDNSDGDMVYVLKEVLPKLTRNEIKELFEDSRPMKKGLYITFGDNKEFECFEVNVLDHDKQIIDQELCENEHEVKTTINDFKREYKILKVLKKEEK